MLVYYSNNYSTLYQFEYLDLKVGPTKLTETVTNYIL